MLARVTAILWFLLFIHLSIAYAAEHDETEMTCVPFGRCEPCPEDSLHEPFCQPFGNRRLMHCTPDDDATTSSSTLSSHKQDGHSPHPRSKGEIPAWQSCGRIVSKERSDFFEFILCNALFAAGALALLFARSRRMEIMHARQLAARIGLVRSGGGVLVRG